MPGTPPKSFVLSDTVNIPELMSKFLINSSSRTRNELKYEASEVNISNFASCNLRSSADNLSAIKLTYFYQIL